MPMNYDDENSQMSGSIFSDPGIVNPAPQNQPVPVEEKKDILSGLIRRISSKLVDPQTGQNIIEQRKMKKITDKMEEEVGEILFILKEYGAKLVYRSNEEFDIVVPRLALSGKITTNKEGELILDDGAKEIFSKMAKYINNRNSFEFTMNMYAEIGFYPVGDLTEETITYKGRKLKVSKGTLMNNKGETRDFYMHNGQEIILDKEENPEE